MSPRLRRAAAAACLITVPLLAAAAGGDGEVRTLGLSDAVRLALAHNPDTRSAGYDVAAAQGALVQASLLQNPSLFVSALGTQASSPLQAPVPNQLGATWTLPIGGKRAAGIAAARATLDATKATYQANRQQLVLSVETAFVTVLLDQSLLQFAELDQSQFQQELQLNELRYKDGKIAYGDLLKLRVQALAIDDALRQARAALTGARADLSQLVGEGVLADDFAAEGDLAPPPDRTVTVQDLLAAALAHRPDYLAAREQERSAEASLSLARRTPIPDLSILADYNHGFRASDAGNPDTYDLTLSVPIPLLDRNQGGIAQAAAALEKARLATESLRLSIHDAVVKAVAEWEASRAQLASYEAGEKTAQESLDISKHSFDLGKGSLLDFLDAEASYRQVESAYRSALARNALAARNLRFIAGEETP